MMTPIIIFVLFLVTLVTIVVLVELNCSCSKCCPPKKLDDVVIDVKPDSNCHTTYVSAGKHEYVGKLTSGMAPQPPKLTNSPTPTSDPSLDFPW